MRWVLLVLVLVAGTAHADLRVRLRDTIAIAHPGATAAFPIDRTVAEVSVAGERIQIVARGVGSTLISIVTPSAIDTLALTVVAPPPWMHANPDEVLPRRWTVYQGGYESATARVTQSLEMVDGDDRERLRAYATHVLAFAGPTELDQKSSFPGLALEWRGRHHELVAFDKLIEHSPLTLDGVTVRGAHVRVRGLKLHAGVTSPLLYQNVFLDTQREAVIGASYEIRAGRSAFVPSVFAFPSTPQTGGTEGEMASLLYRYRSRDERLQLSGELGWGGELGAAGELTYDDVGQRARVLARHQPRGFAALGVGRPLGTVVDAIWTAEPTTTLVTNASANVLHFDTAMGEQRIETATADARQTLEKGLAASIGASYGRFHALETVHSITLPLGLHVENARAGSSLVYRFQHNSSTNRGGHGARLSARLHAAPFHATAFVDAQQDAATVDLILREEPALAQLLAELGLTASTPGELARLLGESAALSQLGYTGDASLEFNPWRVQAGADFALLSRSRAQHQLRLRLFADHTRTVGNDRETATASLTYGLKFGPRVEAMVAGNAWVRDDRETAWSVAGGLRVRFDAVPWRRRATARAARVEPPNTPAYLTGYVRDDAGNGIHGVVVTLEHRDGTGRKTDTTDSKGRYRFTVPDGDYMLRPEPESLPAGYDTHRIVGTPLYVNSGLPSTWDVTVPAHRSIAGTASAGARIRLVEIDAERIADEQGRFVFRGLLPGTYTLEIEGMRRSIEVPSGPAAVRADAR